MKNEYCKECNKKLYAQEQKFNTCKECYFKNKNKYDIKEPDSISIFDTSNNDDQNEKKKEDSFQNNKELTFFDTKKKYPMPGWFLLVIFILGVLIGAWLW